MSDVKLSGTNALPAMPFALSAASKWLPLFLIGAELVFVAIHLGNYALDYPSRLLHRVFYLDGEGNVPAWFSSSQFLLIAIIIAIAAFADDAENRPSRRFLFLIALGFLFLSVDEAAALHEQISMRLKKLDWLPRFSGNHGSWIVFYAVIGAAVISANLRNIFACANRYRKEAVVGGLGAAILLGGAVGAEIVSYEFVARAENDLGYVIQVSIEEFIEMLGATIMLYAALLLLARRYFHNSGRTAAMPDSLNDRL